MEHTKLPSLHDCEVSLNLVTDLVNDDVLLFLGTGTVFERFLDRAPGIKVLFGDSTVKLFRVEHLDGALEAHLALTDALVDSVVPGVHQKECPWLFTLFKLTCCCRDCDPTKRVSRQDQLTAIKTSFTSELDSK